MNSRHLIQRGNDGEREPFCRKCRNKIPIVDLENFLKNELKMFFGQPARIAGHLKEADRNLAEKPSLLSSLLDAHRREIQKVKDEMTRIPKLYVQEQIIAPGFGDFYKLAGQRLNQLLAELPKLEAGVDLPKVNKLSSDDALHKANSLYDWWPNMPTDDKRRVVEALIEKLVIGTGELRITYSFIYISPLPKNCAKTSRS